MVDNKYFFIYLALKTAWKFCPVLTVISTEATNILLRQFYERADKKVCFSFLLSFEQIVI